MIRIPSGVTISDPVTIRDGSGPDVVGTLVDGRRDRGVLLVHGLVGFRQMPEIVAVTEDLAVDRDVLAIDVQGHGDAPGRFSWGRDEWRQVAAAAAFLASGGRRVAAVGFSFGGYHVARAAARGAPMRQIALIGAPVDTRVFDHFPFGRDFWRHVPPALRRRRRLPRLGRPSRFAESEIPEAELAAIELPALVVHCGADWLITRRHAERYATEIRGARLVEIPGALHAEYAVWSHRERLVATIREFLDESP